MNTPSSTTKKQKQPSLNIDSLIKQVDGPISEKTSDLIKRIKQLEAQLIASTAKDTSANRKIETRAKAILGGMILAKSKQDDAFKLMLEKLIAAIDRKQDIDALRKAGLIADEPASTSAPNANTELNRSTY